MPFSIEGDGVYREITLDLSKVSGYKGGMVQLRLDPPASEDQGAWMKIRRVELMK
jgi:hypothetical protein